jgi:hypothetical protein
MISKKIDENPTAPQQRAHNNTDPWPTPRKITSITVFLSLRDPNYFSEHVIQTHAAQTCLVRRQRIQDSNFYL